jgi:nucleoside-diphosphate kinase
MRRPRFETLTAYGVALAAAGLALLCALTLWAPGASNPLAIPSFVAAVVASAWFGGRGPGLVATALGFLAIDYFFEEPVYSLDISSVGTAVDLVGFVLISVLVGALSARANTATTRTRVAPDRAWRDRPVERTLVIIKPDGVERALVGAIIGRFEQRGLRLLALKVTQPDRALIAQHYAHHRSKPFYEDVVAYMTRGPVVAMVLEGADAIPVVRAAVGSPHPGRLVPGTIRGDFGCTRLQTLVHASDALEAAAREIALWFSPDELGGQGTAPLSWARAS